MLSVQCFYVVLKNECGNEPKKTAVCSNYPIMLEYCPRDSTSFIHLCDVWSYKQEVWTKTCIFGSGCCVKSVGTRFQPTTHLVVLGNLRLNLFEFPKVDRPTDLQFLKGNCLCVWTIITGDAHLNHFCIKLLPSCRCLVLVVFMACGKLDHSLIW